MTDSPPAMLSAYQKSVIAVLAFLQFTVVLDFMILSPLGALLMEKLSVGPAQFGLVVSAYAFSAGVAGFLTAGFADRFDRKRFLLVFYVGFIVGTALCGVAWSYEVLLAARVVTGLFGGVLSGASMAIIADVFPFQVRGRVMGTVQTSFAAAQILGIPAGIALSNHWGWHAPFLLIAGVGAAVGVVIALVLRPVTAHLEGKGAKASAFGHLIAAATKPAHLRGFAASVLLATGGFMMMPYGSAFMVNNLGIPLEKLPIVYIVSGGAAFVAGPLIGRLADGVGKYRMFFLSTLATVAVVLVYTHLEGPVSLWVVIAFSLAMFAAVTGRMVTSQALVSAVPEPAERGAFMAINSALQQVSGGIAAVIGGLLIVQRADGGLEHFDRIGWAVGAAALVALVPMAIIDRAVRRQPAGGPS